jgi:hypothetical protein
VEGFISRSTAVFPRGKITGSNFTLRDLRTGECADRTVVSDFARRATYYGMVASKQKGAFVLHLATAKQFASTSMQ